MTLKQIPCMRNLAYLAIKAISDSDSDLNWKLVAKIIATTGTSCQASFDMAPSKFETCKHH